MIKVGDIVTISPAHSVKFGGQKGKVVEISPNDGLSIKVKLLKNGETGNFVFGFAPEELRKDELDG